MARNERHTVDCDPAGPLLTAAYLRVSGDECAFIEVHTGRVVDRLLGALREAGRSPSDVRWVMVTHAHLDHAAGASAVMAACPEATLVCHPTAARHLKAPDKLIAGARAVYGDARFDELYGRIDGIAEHRVRAMADGDTIDLGDSTFTFLHTRGHANHHAAIHDPELDTAYTGDTYGLVYPALQTRGVFVLPSTSPSNFDAVEARKSVARIRALGTRTVCPTHYGEHDAVGEIGDRLGPWLDRAEAWLEQASGFGDDDAAATARLAAAWRSAIIAEADARGLEFGHRELSLLALDIDLNAQGLVAVAAQRRRGR